MRRGDGRGAGVEAREVQGPVWPTIAVEGKGSGKQVMRVQQIRGQRCPITGSTPCRARQGDRTAAWVSEAAALPVPGENQVLLYPNILLHSSHLFFCSWTSWKFESTRELPKRDPEGVDFLFSQGSWDPQTGSPVRETDAGKGGLLRLQVSPGNVSP